MKTTPAIRTWDSVCGDCIHHTQNGCAAEHPTTGKSDCIAAICADFTPGSCAKTENEDA